MALGRLGAVLGRLGAVLGRLGSVLSWGVLGPSWAVLGAAWGKTLKNIEKLKENDDVWGVAREAHQRTSSRTDLSR